MKNAREARVSHSLYRAEGGSALRKVSRVSRGRLEPRAAAKDAQPRTLECSKLAVPCAVGKADGVNNVSRSKDCNPPRAPIEVLRMGRLLGEAACSAGGRTRGVLQRRHVPNIVEDIVVSDNMVPNWAKRARQG